MYSWGKKKRGWWLELTFVETFIFVKHFAKFYVDYLIIMTILRNSVILKLRLKGK